jgi:CRISPR/Cas system-associated endonuclease/helicase Cas3
MSKNQRTKFHVRKRIFLNRDLDMRAFAIGIVEDTREIPTENENGWNSAWIELVLADCYRHVSFDFNLNTKESRANSLYKIRRIAVIVNAVRDAIEVEAKSIDERKIVKPKAKAKSAAG